MRSDSAINSSRSSEISRIPAPDSRLARISCWTWRVDATSRPRLGYESTYSRAVLPSTWVSRTRWMLPPDRVADLALDAGHA